ncbi:SOS response-associated peptidase family protein [Paracoccus sp. IB05]|uniref:SOS response-associated peptidase family protein n=1 Tax=Paracoccus sp. IB05 TaxID=2779367 RepID=UPI0018E70290|nr:SOS response-associated peptidase family protein [Paracoccus sp. IB05]
MGLSPVGGFYEWTGAKGHRQLHFIWSARNEESRFLAGLASRWRDLLPCTILTRAANQDMQDLHNRMPVILNGEERDTWLGGPEDPSLGVDTRIRHHLV